MTISEEFKKPIIFLQEELATLRTGRATPALVEHVRVQAYNATMPLKEVASITVPEPQSLAIQPWDKSLLGPIERAIQESSLGIQPLNDGQMIRLIMPQLTEERRKQLQKVVHQKSEEAKIAIRGIREKNMKAIKQQEQDKSLSEDQSKIEQKKLQEQVDDAVKEIESIAKSKEQEVLTT